MNEDWNYEPTREQSIGALAKASGRSPLDIAYDHMLKDSGKGMIWRSLGGLADVTSWYEDVKTRLSHDRIIPALSDAGAHLAIFQDGTGPVRDAFSTYVRRSPDKRHRRRPRW